MPYPVMPRPRAPYSLKRKTMRKAFAATAWAAGTLTLAATLLDQSAIAAAMAATCVLAWCMASG